MRQPALVVLLTATVIALGGCASTATTDSSTTAPVDQSGFALISLPAATKPFTATNKRDRLLVRDRKNKDVKSAFMNTMAGDHEKEVPGMTSTVVIAIKLPPGDYEIYNFASSRSGRGYFGPVTYSSKSDFSVPFSVSEGQITYLGSYSPREGRGRNVVGLPVTASVYFVVQDQSERDVPIARKKYPNIASLATTTQLPDFKNLSTPLIQSRSTPSVPIVCDQDGCRLDTSTPKESPTEPEQEKQ